jgi:hypothetical protein
MLCFRPKTHPVPRKNPTMKDLEEKFKHILLEYFEVGTEFERVTMPEIKSFLPDEFRLVRRDWKLSVKKVFPDSKMTPTFFIGVRMKTDARPGVLDTQVSSEAHQN